MIKVKVHNRLLFFSGSQATFSRLEGEIKEMNVNSQTLQKNYSDLLEMKAILERADNFFPSVRFGLSNFLSMFSDCIIITKAAQIHLQMHEDGYETLSDNFDHVNIQMDDKAGKPELK